MKRVASLYLPEWPIDRLRRAERHPQRPSAVPPEPAPEPASDMDAASVGTGDAGLGALAGAAAVERAAACSVPRGGGWRPGARWARSEHASERSPADVEAASDALPAHQRPPMREMGRRSEAAAHPFKGVDTNPHTVRGHGLVDPPVRAWARALGCADDRSDPRFPESPMQDEVQNGAQPDPDRPGRVPATGHAASDPDGTVMPDRPAAAAARAPHPRARPADHAAPTLADRATMPAVRYHGEGLRPDRDNRTPPGYPGAGRFFQTGRTLGSVVTRACPEPGGSRAAAASPPAAPPLVTVTRNGGRMEIAAACPAARALGLAPGTALTQARALVPGLDVRPADPDGDRADLLALATVAARRWTPVVAVSDDDSGGDGLFLDLTGVSHLHGGEAAMARRLVRLLARLGIVARVAVADTAGAAWAIARHLPRSAPPRSAKGQAGPRPDPDSAPDSAPDNTWTIIPPGDHYAALAPLPVAALRLDERATELLRRLGVDTVGQVVALPRAPLVRRFGAAVARRIDQATGALPEPLDAVVPPARVAVVQRFAEPIATAEAIAHWLGVLMPRLTTALAQAGQGARAIELVADRVDGVPQFLRVGLARPTRDPAHLLRLALRRIEEIAPGYGIDALHLRVRRADPLGPESLAPALAEETAPDLAPLVDTLANRIGARALWRTRPVESDIPERSVTVRPPLDPPDRAAPALRADDVGQLDGRTPDHPWHPRWPRPVRLLRRPEPLDHVMAEMPDGHPARFTWRGVVHRVVRGDGPERIHGEWWRRAAERDAVRDYFSVEDDQGQRFWLFRRGDGMRAETGDLGWYLHGLFG